MVKQIVVLFALSIFVLVGCSNDLPSKSSQENVATVTDSKNDVEKIKLSDLSGFKYLPFSTSNNSEYKIPNLELDNAEVIILEPISLKKSENLTVEFELQSNDSINNMTIGFIKDYSPDGKSNYEIEKIYSESIDKELTFTYTSLADSNYSICILGTMADTVVVKNGKLIKH